MRRSAKARKAQTCKGTLRVVHVTRHHPRVIDWTHLPFLLVASRSGSLAAAARALKVDPATVGRHVGALEREIGGKLLRRKPGGGYEPTELGARLLSAAGRTEEALIEVARSARAETSDVAGVLRITTVDVVATQLLAPALVRLRERHPELLVDLVVTPQVLDPSRDVDVALRLVRPKDPTLVTRKLATMELGVFGSARLLASLRLSRDARRFPAELPVIGYGEHFIAVPENEWLGRLESPRVALRTTSVGAAASAAEAGLGFAMLPTTFAGSGDLVRVPGLGAATRDVWLVVHPDLAKSPKVRAIADLLGERAGRAGAERRRR